MGESPHVQFVLGVKNAMPCEEPLLDILLAETQRVLPKATWTAAGIGRFQSEVIEWVLARGGERLAHRARRQYSHRQKSSRREQCRTGRSRRRVYAPSMARGRPPRARRAPTLGLSGCIARERVSEVFRGLSMSKIYKDADAALAGVDQGRHDDHVRRLRPLRHARNADRGDQRIGREGSDRRSPTMPASTAAASACCWRRARSRR